MPLVQVWGKILYVGVEGYPCYKEEVSCASSFTDEEGTRCVYRGYKGRDGITISGGMVLFFVITIMVSLTVVTN